MSNRQKQTYGYVRISTTEQHEDRQLIALLPFAIPPKNLYIDKQSGKIFSAEVPAADPQAKTGRLAHRQRG